MENIQVVIRLRPLSQQEISQGEESIWGIQAPHHVYLQPTLQKELVIGKRLVTGTRTTFNFDSCFDSNETNEQIYCHGVKNIVQGSLKGMNGTVFVYGQTGSGKTYTMLGPHDKPQKGFGSERGILFQSLAELFDTIERDLDKTYVLRCSYIEIYNEQIFDLLKPSSKLAEVLTINEDQKREFFVKGVIEESVSSVKEILQVLQRGEINRHYAQTSMNHHSSRSHSIFRLTVQSITNNFIRNYRREQSQRNMPNLQQQEEIESLQEQNEHDQPSQIESIVPMTQGALITESVLNFVDLAGSEKVSNHTCMDESFTYSVVENRHEEVNTGQLHRTKDRVKEGQYINKSLFFLTQVIFLKAEDKGHIPYRNSSLTKILRSSLGGNSRTLIILCINPTHSQFEYSLSTIRFGINAKKIENKVRANIHNHNDDEAIKIIISEYEKKIRDLEKARVEDKEILDSVKDQLKIKSKICDDLERRLSNVNKQNFDQQAFLKNEACDPQEIYFKLNKKNKIAQSVIDVKKRQGFHLDDVGDIFFVQKGKSKIKIDVMNKQNHDCQGKIAKAAFKLQKQRSSMLQDQLGILIENYHKMKEDYLTLFLSHTQISKVFNQQTIQFNRLQEGLTNILFYLEGEIQSKIYSQIFKKAEEMAQTLDLTQLPQLNNFQIKELKEFYQTSLKQIEKEEWRRDLIQQLEIKQPIFNNCQIIDQCNSKQKLHTRSSGNLVAIKETVNENILINALYGSLQNHDGHIRQITDLGQKFFRKTSSQSSFRIQDTTQQIRFEKSGELDFIFFEGFNEQWNQDQGITFDQMNEEMKLFDMEQQMNSTQSISSLDSTPPRIRSISKSYQSKNSANGTFNPVNDTDQDEIITLFDNNQIDVNITENIEFQPNDTTQKTFNDALMEFIGVVDTDKVDQSFKDDISLQGIDKLNSFCEPFLTKMNQDECVQLKTQKSSQSYLTTRNQITPTPGKRQQPPNMTALTENSSRTPTGKTKSIVKNSFHIVQPDRSIGYSKSQARYATTVRQQTSDYGKHQTTNNAQSFSKSSKRSSASFANKTNKSQIIKSANKQQNDENLVIGKRTQIQQSQLNNMFSQIDDEIPQDFLQKFDYF